MSSTPNETPEIANTNDAVRQTLLRDCLVITTRVAQLSEQTKARVFLAVEAFNDFKPDNDPHQEHDFGRVTVDRHDVFFKFDYYDNALSAHSPDVLDRAVTRRVLTIMLASEY